MNRGEKREILLVTRRRVANSIDVSSAHIIIISVIICAAIFAPLSLAWHFQRFLSPLKKEPVLDRRKEHQLQRMPWRVAYEEMKSDEDVSGLP